MRIDTNRFRSPARYAWVGRIIAFHDRYQGRRDAPGLRARLASLPHPDTLPRGAADPYPELLTPHVQGIRASASRGADQLRSRLLHDERELCARIHAESVRVVTQYDVRQAPAPAALARYGELIGVWRASAGVCRGRAAVLTHEANQRLARYWTAALTDLQSRAGEGPFPLDHPHLLPGHIVLDESWQHTDDWLRVDGGLWAAPARGRTEHPVTRALAILDAQPVRGADPAAPHRAAAGPGRGRG
ncbi:hypothetical protein ACIA74_10045 [Streptomyces sp. NPDC051658]|uniref:hypothetical protein n=1 Tax=Streptomyces sp. NPDC051658 TaxID=3365667 RepID=UPI00378FD238